MVNVGDQVKFKDYYGYRNQRQIETTGNVSSIHNGTIYIKIPFSYRNYGRDGDGYDTDLHPFFSEFEFGKGGRPDAYITSRDKGRMEVLNVWLEIITPTTSRPSA
jgi:hypothetical protein